MSIIEYNGAELQVPRHIAIILDGNGRWAKRRGLPRAMGHKAGCETLERTIEDCVRMGVDYLTVYAFSTENWKRSEEEVGALMNLFRFYLDRFIKTANENNVRARMIGERSRFSADIRQGIENLEERTRQNTGLTFVFAMNYGGRDEIVRAVRRYTADLLDAAAASSGTARDEAPEAGTFQDFRTRLLQKTETLTETEFASYLDTAGLPDPDLMIRTSGELRISNFLPWQLAYAEFYVTDVLWPDFDREELLRAVESYNRRERRFGGRLH